MWNHHSLGELFIVPIEESLILFLIQDNIKN